MATGTGRNAVFLASQGHEVDGVDISREALSEAQRRAEEEGVDVNWIQADLDESRIPKGRYSGITTSFYYDLNLLADLKEGLRRGGVLIYENHLRSEDDLDVGPTEDRYRFGSNELLRSCLDLTVLHYSERKYELDGRTGAKATIVARKSSGASQSYPEPGNP